MPECEYKIKFPFWFGYWLLLSTLIAYLIELKFLVLSTTPLFKLILGISNTAVYWISNLLSSLTGVSSTSVIISSSVSVLSITDVVSIYFSTTWLFLFSFLLSHIVIFVNPLLKFLDTQKL